MPYVVTDKVREPLYVVTPIFNPARFKSRWKNYQRFQKHMRDSGAVLYTVEAAFGEREHAIQEEAPHKFGLRLEDAPPLEGETEANCNHDDPRRCGHRYIRLRTAHELWLKENLINIGVSRLPSDWKYVAWIDADVTFLRPNWVGETIHQLQHYDFLQMFSHAQDLDSGYRVTADRPSFMAQYQAGEDLPAGYYSFGAPERKGAWSGLAWAARRRAWDSVGGLIDFAIHGGGDWHMAFALVGQAKKSVRKDVHQNYIKRVMRWQELCERHIRRNVGVMTGTVAHNWHGPKALRKYAQRHKLLAEVQFNPDTDMKYDGQGLLCLEDDGSERFLGLRDGLREYARARDEDQLS